MIPTQIFYDASGKELFRHTGFFGKEDILGKWKELGVELAAAAEEVATNHQIDPEYEDLTEKHSDSDRCVLGGGGVGGGASQAAQAGGPGRGQVHSVQGDGPILKDLKAEYAGRMDVEFIDVWKNPDAGQGVQDQADPDANLLRRLGQGALPARRLLWQGGHPGQVEGTRRGP